MSLRSRYRMACKASLEPLLPCGVQMGQKAVVALMLCCEGASLGRWVITQVRFCRLVARVQNRRAGCSSRLKGPLLRSTLRLERRSRSRAGSSDWGTPRWAPNRQAAMGEGTAANEACFWLLPLSALALGRALIWKGAEIKYKTPFPPESLV